MPNAPTISRKPEAGPALDQAALFAEGMDHVRALCGSIWTDHNDHDPGVTILEIACYAMTELAYRADFPIEDLLAAPVDNAKAMAGQFLTPRAILPNRPLTALDYRKLMMDCEGVANAWIAPIPTPYVVDRAKGVLRHGKPAAPTDRTVEVRGLYQPTIAYEQDVNTPEARAEVRARVLARLRASRNLSEDFAEPIEVDDAPFAACGEVELNPGADPVATAAAILRAVERYLAPPVRWYSLSERLARRGPDGEAPTVPEIFTGPPLASGFLDDDELDASELRAEIRLSDLFAAVAGLEGVRSIRDLIVNATVAGRAQPPADRWRVPVPAGKRPTLDAKRSRLVLYRGPVPIVPEPAKVEAALDAIRRAEQAGARKGGDHDLPIPLGRYRRPGRYVSFQRHFPEVYGLSDRGLPSGSDDARKAAALQLKGYLLAFDQILANGHAQLENLRSLFGPDAGPGRTYFSQVVDSFRDHERIYPEPKPGEDMEQTLSDLVEPAGGDASIGRQGRFLDHRLARLSEDFHRHADVLQGAFGVTPSAILEAQRALLKDAPALGAGRGLGAEPPAEPGRPRSDSRGVSGLERRVARLLGLQGTRTSLAKDEAGEFRFVVADPFDDGTPLLESAQSQANPADALKDRDRAMARASQVASYKESAEPGGGVVVVDEDGTALAFAPGLAGPDGPEVEARAALIAALGAGEVVSLVELFLLRPDPAHPEFDEPFLPICLDPGCPDCGDADPYSYRIQVVLPADRGRFDRPEFRRYVEETIRIEAPAHLLPKVCWVASGVFAKFEAAFLAWKSLRPEDDGAARKAALTDLIEVLTTAKSIYPKQKLRDCGGEGGEPPFLLGRTALGSKS